MCCADAETRLASFILPAVSMTEAKPKSEQMSLTLVARHMHNMFDQSPLDFQGRLHQPILASFAQLRTPSVKVLQHL